MNERGGTNEDVVFATQDWKRIEALLDAALQLDVASREAWLDNLGEGDRPHAGTLRRLLAASDADSNQFMRHPVGIATLDAVAEDIDGDSPGQIVGGYQLENRLGSGGMSTVWLARDIERVLNRRVALKLPKLGWQPGVAERMRQEWAILASLEHPGIARLYDAGNGADGRPFIAMEHIDGIPIDKHVRAHAHSLPAVLNLVLQVADALSFAHGRLVVHRDIKPSNILVNRSGQVKLLDFGVARLLERGVAPQSDLTLSQGRVMTPGYASPEQVTGQSVTVASDVYSLGVVLYELLAGVRPYRLRRQTPAALEEAILEADIPLASRQAAQSIPWKRDLRGDLDSILAKAMRRDPAQRYGSIGEFADDLRRHLDGVPVRAQPMRWSYSARKFIGRHRVGVGVLALFVMLLAAGVSAVMWQAEQARVQAKLAADERDRAVRELRYAQATEEYIRFILAESLAQGRTLADVLKSGEQIVGEQLGRDPALRARLQLALAQLYSELEDRGRRETMIAQARESALQAGDEMLQDAIQCVAAGELFTRGKHQQAMAMFDETIARVETRAGNTLALQACLAERTGASRVLGRPAQAIADARRALALVDTTSPGNYSKVVGLRSQIADAITLSGDMHAAVEEHRQLVNQYFSSGRGRTSLGLYVVNHYILSLARAGQVAEAQSEYRRILELLSVGANQNYSVLMHNHARLLVSMGRYEEATEEIRRMVGAEGPQRSRSLGLFSGLFPAMIACGKQAWSVCLERVSQSDARVQDALLAGHSIHATHHWLRAWAMSGLGEQAAALASVERAIERYAVATDRNPYLVRARILRAELLDVAGRREDARDEMDRALADAKKFSAGFQHSEWTGRALLAQARLLMRHGNTAAAMEVFAQARVELEASLGADAPIARDARLEEPAPCNAVADCGTLEAFRPKGSTMTAHIRFFNGRIGLHAVLLATSLLPCFAHARADAAMPAQRPTFSDVLKASQPADWRSLDPARTLYLELPAGRVVIELHPALAPKHVANIVALAKEGWFDGGAIIRSQDNYVAQWGHPDEKRQVKQAKRNLMGEFTTPVDKDFTFTRLPDVDGYAPEVGFSQGFPVGRDPKTGSAWLAHCYGTVGVGRGNELDSGDGTSLYAVTGHAPRHLDRNITVVGRVVQGMPLLSSLPRGTGNLGFYEKPEQNVPIKAVRVAADVPAAERTELEVMRTDSATFAKAVEALRNRPGDWFKVPAGHIELCNVQIPVRPIAR